MHLSLRPKSCKHLYLKGLLRNRSATVSIPDYYISRRESLEFRDMMVGRCPYLRFDKPSSVWRLDIRLPGRSNLFIEGVPSDGIWRDEGSSDCAGTCLVSKTETKLH